MTTPQVTILQLRRGAVSGRLDGTVTKQKLSDVAEKLFVFSIVRTLKKAGAQKNKQAEKLPTSIQEDAGSHLSGTPAIRTGFHELPYYLQ